MEWSHLELRRTLEGDDHSPKYQKSRHQDIGSHFAKEEIAREFGEEVGEVGEGEVGVSEEERGLGGWEERRDGNGVSARGELGGREDRGEERLATCLGREDLKPMSERLSAP